MVHISEVSTSFVNDIKDFLKIGQEVKVKVLNISEDGKISLSIRRAAEMTSSAEMVESVRSGRPEHAALD